MIFILLYFLYEFSITLLDFPFYILLKDFNIKTKLVITLTISYQFQTLIPRIDPEFYCGSRGMGFKYSR